MEQMCRLIVFTLFSPNSHVPTYAEGSKRGRRSAYAVLAVIVSSNPDDHYALPSRAQPQAHLRRSAARRSSEASSCC